MSNTTLLRPCSFLVRRASRDCIDLDLVRVSGTLISLRSGLNDGLRSHKILLDDWHLNASPQENGLIREHKSQLLVTDGRTSAYNQRVDQHLVLSGGAYSISNHVPNLFEDLLNLTRQHTDEDDVGLSSHLLVVEEALDPELLLERSQKMRLSR